VASASIRLSQRFFSGDNSIYGAGKSASNRRAYVGRVVYASHSGSTFDSIPEKEGIREEIESVAIKRVVAGQLSQAMRNQRKTKQAMAKQLRTSRSQLDRRLDPRNVAVTLDTMHRAARALGKRLIARVVNARAKAG